jgi:hypothetical protein
MKKFSILATLVWFMLSATLPGSEAADDPAPGECTQLDASDASPVDSNA